MPERLTKSPALFSKTKSSSAWRCTCDTLGSDLASPQRKVQDAKAKWIKMLTHLAVSAAESLSASASEVHSRSHFRAPNGTRGPLSFVVMTRTLLILL